MESSLDVGELSPDPFEQFSAWLADAESAGVVEPTAMTLATAGGDGAPDARVVLLKGLDGGFWFFTNYESAKGRQIQENPRAALVVHWRELSRQVRARGRVEMLAHDLSAGYFASRPPGSRLGAWASRQSEVIESREALEAARRAAEERFGGEEPPLPPFWGGYRLVPDSVEFWQGRPDRLHDRLRYRLDGGAWVIERLQP
ncbi:MAG: pyridoxamine 5'-phosphate oxidase [Acidimicrobiia bacterium]